MARFMGSVSGKASTDASRLGNEHSGIQSHTRGWDLGVRVHGRAVGGRDEFEVSLTGGSHNPTQTRHVFRVFDQDGNVRIEYNGNAYEIFDGNLRPLVVGIH